MILSKANDRLPMIGSAFAAGIATAVVAVQFLLGVSIVWSDPSPLALVAPLAVPISAVLARHHARSIATAREFDMVSVVLFAAQGVLFGSLTVSIFAAIAAVGRGVIDLPADVLVDVIQLTLLGLGVYGLPIYVVSLPLVMVWAVLLRAFARRAC